jgi:Fe-S cluster assembly protein SufB
MAVQGIDLGKYKLGWHDSTDDYVYAPKKGLNEHVVRDISAHKDEPEWMTKFRLNALKRFERKPMLDWFAKNMPDMDFDDIYYYLKPTEGQVSEWSELPEAMQATYEKLGIPEAERKFLAGVTTQYESEVVYHRNREDLEKRGILFTSMDHALRDYPDLVKEHFGTVIPPGDNKFAALNSAVWSGGCLTADARINVRGRGVVSIADIEEGDEVFGVNLDRELERGKVLAKVASGVKPVYRMRAAGRTLEATANHQFLVARRRRVGNGTRWITEWAPLEEIAVGEPIAVSRVLPDDGAFMRLPEPIEYIKNRSRQRLSFPAHATRDLCWLLGLWLGDGHTAAPHEHMRQISFSIPAEDPVNDAAKTALRRVFGVDHVTDVKCGFVVSSKELGVWLEDAGFSGHAKTKRVPSWVSATPHEHQLALIGGLVDADGWTERDGKSMCIELANHELLEDVRQLAIGCGLFADGVLTERTRGVTFSDGHVATSTCWRLRLQGDLERVATRDPNKRGVAADHWRRNAYGAATGLNFATLVTDTVGFAVLKEKELVGEKPTYDIQVVGLENFVANGIVAHNSFIYVPPGEHVDMPLQAYFRINQENAGQFERTLIIADEGASVHYVEGCSAPVYSTDSLHSAVVELIAKPGARIRYTTIQNWSPNVYNLVTKRARAETEATVEWIDGNLGSKLTMKYPAVVMTGPKAHGEVLSVAYAGPGQHQDAGAKMTHAAPETTSIIDSKSISKDGGRTTYRGLVKVEEGAHGVKSHVRCDALILDEESRSDTYPYMEIAEKDARIGHEATVSKVGDDQLFYLQSRGLTEQQATAMIVNGFIEPITKTLPMEYAVELSRLIELNMEGAVG